MNNDKRKESIIASLLAAMLIPRIQKWTGVTLDINDIVDLMVAAALGWHALAATFEKYFPPPAPRAAEPATTNVFIKPSEKTI